MKILITGHSGFIGSYLQKKLEKTEHELILLDIANGTNICDWQQVKQYEGMDVIVHSKFNICSIILRTPKEILRNQLFGHLEYVGIV